MMAVANIDNKEDAALYAEDYPMVNLIFLHEGLDNETYHQMKDTLEVGDHFQMQFYHLSVVEKSSKELVHCRYIYIDQKNLGDGEGVSIQEKIHKGLEAGAQFDSLHAIYSMDNNPNQGNLGYVDPDHLSEGFKNGLRSHEYGDIFTCSDDSLGWYYVVEITKEPRKVDGHYVLVYPEQAFSDENVDHEANLRNFSSDAEIKEYAAQHNDVMITLKNSENDLQFFWNIEQLKEKGEYVVGNKMDIDGTRFVILKDTTVKLYTFQYIFIDGEKVSEEERKKRMNDINDRYMNGESFEVLIEAYGPENTEYNTMSNMEGALLADELVAQLDSKNPKEIFVARLSQSYFIGILLEPVKEAEAYLSISYPIYTK